ncbi:MAG: hypothetical protein H2057_07390 [Alphaproteobacteria bacterium]|nr:hypothetical protein [Alphaproteobacteria bacterium]
MTQKLKNALWMCVVVIAVIAPYSVEASLWHRLWGASEDQQNGQGTPIGAIAQDTDFITGGPSLQGQALDFDLTASTLGLGSDFVVLDTDEKESAQKEGSAAFYCSKEKFSQIMKEARDEEKTFPCEANSVPVEPIPFKTIEKKQDLDSALIFSTPLQYGAYLEFLKRVPSARKVHAIESYHFPLDALEEIEVFMNASRLPAHERLNHTYTHKAVQARYQLVVPFITEENLEIVFLYPFVSEVFFSKSLKSMKKGKHIFDFDHEGMGVLHYEALRILGPDTVRALTQTFRWILVFQASQAQEDLANAFVSHILDAEMITDQKEESVPSVLFTTADQKEMERPLVLEESGALPPTNVPVQQAILAAPGNGFVVPCVLGFGALVIGSLFLSHHK